jgi:tRNA-dihydrouridine synthase
VAPNPAEAVIGAKHLDSYSAEIIDLNLACPAPSISRKRKSGGHLLSNLTLVEAMLTAVRAEVPCPFTVKIRLGKKPDLIFLRDIAATLEHCGVDAVTLHPRLTTEKLKRRARWEYIGHLKTMLSIPVIGNGDVQNRADCLKMFAQTGCDGVMIGRAAVQKPWIFSEITECPPLLTTDFLETTYADACRRILDFFPQEKAIGRIKEFSWYFSKNLKFGHLFAARLQSQKNLDQCLKFMKENFMKAVA